MVSMVLPLFYGAALTGRRQAPDSQMEGDASAYLTDTQALQGRRTEVQAKTAASRIALGLRQQDNIKLW
jgi:hypothetical protein